MTSTFACCSSCAQTGKEPAERCLHGPCHKAGNMLSTDCTSHSTICFVLLQTSCLTRTHKVYLSCCTGSRRRLLDAVGISNVREGPDHSNIAVNLVDVSSFVPEGNADASAAGATTTQVTPQWTHLCCAIIPGNTDKH